MATERLSMKKTRDVLRLRFEQGCTQREIARSLGIGVGTVNGTLKRAAVAGLDWIAASALDDIALDERLYGVPLVSREPRPAGWP